MSSQTGSNPSLLDANNADSQGITYSLDSPVAGEATVSGYSGTGGASIVIPSSIVTVTDSVVYSVVKINDGALNGKSITSLSFPDTLRYIGSFSSCGNNLFTTLTIPSSVTFIGNSAFSDCANLVSIVCNTGSSATIDSSWVNRNTNLTSISLPNNNNIAYGTNSDGSTDNFILYDLSKTTPDVFWMSSSKTSITIPDSINGHVFTTINSNFLPSTIKEIHFPSTITTFASGACISMSLTEFTIPSTVVSIGTNIFFDPWNHPATLTTLTIANVVTNANLFNELPALNTVNILVDHPNFVKDNGCIYNKKNGDTELELAWVPKNLTSLVMPSTPVSNLPVTSIASRAAYQNSNLTLLTIGANVTTISDDAFRGSSALASVTIPPSVTSIGNNVFQNCSALTSVTIPHSVTSIGNNAFHSCSALASVIIGSGVTSIGANAFQNCSALTSMTIPDLVTMIRNYTFYNCSALTLVVIGNAVTSIGVGAFWGCSALTLVTIGITVTSIGDEAFENCSALTLAPIGTGVTSIGANAFKNCSALTAVIIADSVTSIDNFVFAFCNGLKDVFIGSGVTNISVDAFFGSKNILNFLVSLNNTVLCNDPSDNGVIYKIENNSATVYNIIPTKVSYEILNVINQKSVTSVRDKAFRGCDKLVYVTIPNSVTHIGNEGFNDCTVLSNVVIGTGVINIGSQAFQNAALTYVTIPDSVTSIGSHAFVGCSALASVIFLGNNVTSTDNKDFFQNNQFLNLPNTAICYYVNGKTGWNTYTSFALPSGFSDMELYVIYFQSMNHYGGILIVPANGVVGNMSGGTLSLGSGSIITLLSGGTVDVNTSGVRTITNTNGNFTLNQTSGTVNVETLDGISTAVVAISASRNLNVERGAFSGTLSGAGTLSKTTSGTLTISGANSGFSGDIQVTEGILKALYGHSLGSGYIQLGAGVPGNSADVTLQIESAFTEIVFNQINCLSAGNNDIYNTSADSLTLNGGVAKNGTKARLLGNIEVRSNITGSTANSDIYIGNGDDVSGNVTFATGNTYDFNGPTIVTSGSTLTLEDNVQLANSDVTIQTGGTLVLQYDTLGFKMKSLNMESGSYLVVSADLSANTYTLIDCSAASTLSTTVTVTYGGSLTATVSVANSQDIQLIVVDATATPSSNICFPAKTPVITNQGPVNIEDINPKIHTIRNKKIVAITKTVAHDKNLVRIAKHALGHLYPEKTTTMSQNHKVFFQGQMVKAKHLVDESNGVTLVPYKGEILYNVLLEEHEKMQVNNLIVETLHPEHKVANLYRFLKNVDAAHHGKLIALFNKKDKEHRKSTL